MKNFRFKKKNSIIRTLKEPSRVKKSTNWERIIFLGLALTVIFYLGRFLFNSFAMVEANGQVIFENVDVQFIEDIRIGELLIEEGDTVNAGDSLFYYTNHLDEGNGINTISQKIGTSGIEHELMNVQNKISSQKVLISSLKMEIGVLQNQMVNTKMMILIENATRRQFDDLKLNIEMSHLKLLESQKMLQLLRNQYQYFLRKKIEIFDSSGNFSSEVTTSVHKAPVSGIVGKINSKTEEICYQKESIFKIHKPEEVSIHAYFAQDHIEDIYPGRVVQVLFPDGTRSKGSIGSYALSTITLPEEFQKKYEPTTRSILAEIIPLELSSQEKWRRFFKMDVVVRIPRFGSKHR